MDDKPPAPERVYELKKSGLRLEGTRLSKHDGDALVADHQLGDLSEVNLRFGRKPEDAKLAGFFLVLFLGCVAGIAFWAHPKGSLVGWFGLGLLAMTCLLMLIGFLASGPGCWLVLKRRYDEVTYALEEEPGVAEAFLSELRERAEREGLRVRFSVLK